MHGYTPRREQVVPAYLLLVRQLEVAAIRLSELCTCLVGQQASVANTHVKQIVRRPRLEMCSSVRRKTERGGEWG
jgi:hypothetical protein